MKIPLSDIEFCACCGYIKSQCECEKIHTNADHIGAMSDEELAEFLTDDCVADIEGTEECTGDCKPCFLEWLKSEVKE